LKKNHNFKLGDKSYNCSVIWSRNGEETGRINYDLLLDIGKPRIILHYKSRIRGESDWTSKSYTVYLKAVDCHFGGVRWYFSCVGCRKRVAVLYSHDHYFICRKCARLTYDSCNESKRMRGYPWKILSDEWKADELLKEVKRTHYRGKPTRKYQRCLDLWNSNACVLSAEKQLFNRL
jgi:hypothetical protein